MSIIINGITLGSDASIDSTKLNKIIFNNTTVWESIAPPIEIELTPQTYQTTYWVGRGTYNELASSGFYLNNIIKQSCDWTKYKYIEFYYTYSLTISGQLYISDVDFRICQKDYIIDEGGGHYEYLAFNHFNPSNLYIPNPGYGSKTYKSDINLSNEMRLQISYRGLKSQYDGRATNISFTINKIRLSN